MSRDFWLDLWNDPWPRGWDFPYSAEGNRIIEKRERELNTMGVSPTPLAVRRRWAKKFDVLLEAQEKARENYLIAIFQAREEGVSQAVIAGLAGISPDSIHKRAAEGEAILKEQSQR